MFPGQQSILSGVTAGIIKAGQRIVIGGIEKSGKTTLAANAPRSLLVPLEKGFGAITTPKTPMIETITGVFQLCEEILDALSRRQFPYHTVVWDSGTALETFIHTNVISLDPNSKKSVLSMETSHGGYGKAYPIANDQFARFLWYCDQMAFKFGINIIITCHVFSSLIKDPTSGEYETWDLLLHSPKNNKSYGKREMLTQWADMISFLYEPYMIIINDNEKMRRAVSANRGRVLGVTRTPQYVAGNRYDLINEISIPANSGWNYLADAIYQSKGIDLFNRD